MDDFVKELEREKRLRKRRSKRRRKAAKDWRNWSNGTWMTVNLYAGECAFCEKEVEAEGGVVVRTADTKRYAIFHRGCYESFQACSGRRAPALPTAKWTRSTGRLRKTVQEQRAESARREYERARANLERKPSLPRPSW